MNSSKVTSHEKLRRERARAREVAGAAVVVAFPGSFEQLPNQDDQISIERRGYASTMWTYFVSYLRAKALTFHGNLEGIFLGARRVLILPHVSRSRTRLQRNRMVSSRSMEPAIGAPARLTPLVLGVEQEVLAQLALISISRLLAANAAAEHGIPAVDASPKAAVLAIAKGIVRLMLCDAPDLRMEHHAQLLRQIARRRVIHRPGRTSPRISFKPSPRWNSKGRVGG